MLMATPTKIIFFTVLYFVLFSLCALTFLSHIEATLLHDVKIKINQN